MRARYAAAHPAGSAPKTWYVNDLEGHPHAFSAQSDAQKYTDDIEKLKREQEASIKSSATSVLGLEVQAPIVNETISEEIPATAPGGLLAYRPDFQANNVVATPKTVTLQEIPMSTSKNKAVVVLNGIEKVAEEVLELIVHPTVNPNPLSTGTTAAIAILLQEFLAVTGDVGADVAAPAGLVNIPVDLAQFNDIKALAETIKADVAKIGIKL